MGQVIPLPAQHGFQITQKLSLQHALSVPVQLRPAQLPAAQPGQGEAGAGGQAAPLTGPDGPAVIELPAVPAVSAVQGGGSQADHPLRPGEEPGHPGRGLVLPRLRQGDDIPPQAGAGLSVIGGKDAVSPLGHQVAPW